MNSVIPKSRKHMNIRKGNGGGYGKILEKINKDRYIIGFVLTIISILIFVPVGYFAPADIHPNMYVNTNEIDVIKEKVRTNQEPWKTAYDRMIADANTGLNTPIQSVTYGGKTPPSGDIQDYYSESPYTSDGVYNPNADRTDYNSAMAIGKTVRDLGMGYAFTGDSRYADKAIQLINAWTVNPSTKMNPKFTSFNGQTYAELPITMTSMYYGADLIWNYPGWSSSDKQGFQSWVRDLSVSRGRVKENDPPNHLPSNYMNWQIVFISASAVITGDTADFDWAFQYWKELIPQQMDSEGRMINENWRSRGLFYSLFAVNAMLQGAEIARHRGIDLYNYKTSDGRGLELTLDYHAPYAAGKQTWPYQEINPGLIEYALYELAYSFKQKQSYMDVINTRGGRPMYENRIMGYVTLTHANTNLEVSPTPSTGPTTGVTPAPTTQDVTPIPDITSAPGLERAVNGGPTVECYKRTAKKL